MISQLCCFESYIQYIKHEPSGEFAADPLLYQQDRKMLVLSLMQQSIFGIVILQAAKCLPVDYCR